MVNYFYYREKKRKITITRYVKQPLIVSSAQEIIKSTPKAEL